MTTYLLDCNHLSSAIRKVSAVRDRIQQARKDGCKFATCVPVLCELEAGIQQTGDMIAFRRRLSQLRKHCSVWTLDEKTTIHYGTIYNEMRRHGRVLSQVDMILAALARQHRVAILTADKDFEAIPDVITENWL